MSKLIVGVDPGKKGAFAFITPDGTGHTMKVPLIKSKELDTRELARLVRGFVDLGEEVVIVLEDVHSIFGASAGSNFAFGHINGFLEGLCNAYGYRYHKVQPKTWQKMMHEGIPVITKPAKKVGGKPTKDTKAMSLMAAKRLFPDYSFTKGRGVVPDDNIVDAVLLMEYGRRVFG